MDFSYYISFFHDGGIESIIQNNGALILEMVTCSINEDENKENLTLDTRDRLHGRLIISGVKNLQVNSKPLQGHMYMAHDDGEILDFEIRKNLVEIGIQWRDFPPKQRYHGYGFYEIEAAEIVWEDRVNGIRIPLTGLNTGKTMRD